MEETVQNRRSPIPTADDIKELEHRGLFGSSRPTTPEPSSLKPIGKLEKKIKSLLPTNHRRAIWSILQELNAPINRLELIELAVERIPFQSQDLNYQRYICDKIIYAFKKRGLVIIVGGRLRKDQTVSLA